MSSIYSLVAILGMTAITVVTRGFFLLSEREWPLPAWVNRGLRYAPLAALAAVIAPEIVLMDGALVDNWRSPRLFAALAGTLYFWWRRDILGTIVVGTATMLALKLALGW